MSKDAGDYPWHQLLGQIEGEQRTLTLYTRLARAVDDGRLAPNTLLPSTRALAQLVGLSRNTVVHVYGQLVDEGYIVSKDRSGYVVRAARATLTGKVGSQQIADAQSAWTDDKFVRPVSQLRRLLKTQMWRACRYAFVYGQHDPESFPLDRWREVERETTGFENLREWAADPYDVDNARLIAQVKSRILPRRGIWAREEEILITSGTQNAIFLIAQLLARSDTRVAFEEPGYPDAQSAFEMHTPHILHAPVDRDGMVVSELPPGVDYVYCTPSHQWPTTATMSAARREELYRYAVENNTIIIEDDYDAELRFSSGEAPALKSSDYDGRVIYVGSFSKSLAPGLRIGYLVAPAVVVRELRYLRRLVTRNPPGNNQQAIATFIERGYYDSHLRRLRKVYAERYEAVREALETLTPEIDFNRTEGGSAVWGRLPAGVSSTDLSRALKLKGCYVEVGDHFFRHPPQLGCVRFGYSSIGLQLIRPGIELVRTELQRLIREAGSASR